MATNQPTECAHPDNRQSSDEVTNEILCLDCNELRDLMPWDEWDRLKITDPNGDETEVTEDKAAA